MASINQELPKIGDFYQDSHIYL
jgi:hypothetical protein